MIGRATQVVDCRESMGLAKGGGLAQRGTLSEATKPDVIAIAMSPGRRHITKPVCEMTYGLRREGIQTSVLVLEAGTGLPDSFPQASRGYGPTFGVNERELEQIARHKIAVFHLGNVRSHVISKAKVLATAYYARAKSRQVRDWSDKPDNKVKFREMVSDGVSDGLTEIETKNKIEGHIKEEMERTKTMTERPERKNRP